MEKHCHNLKIPKERIAVLIGTKGEVKSEIEDNTKTKINIDSEEGDVVITGSDAVNLYTANEIIKAIARGFNPDIAQLLLKQDYCFILLDLSDFCKQSDLKRIKGRIIGKEGKSRATLETLTDSHISVYGKTVGIIGLNETAIMAKDAIQSLIRGKPHSKVYSALERQRKDMKNPPI